MVVAKVGAVPHTFSWTHTSPATPTTDDLVAAPRWALDNDRDALLEHRIAILTQASWEVQAETERRLVARFLHAVGRCPSGAPH